MPWQRDLGAGGVDPGEAGALISAAEEVIFLAVTGALILFPLGQ